MILGEPAPSILELVPTDLTLSSGRKAVGVRDVASVEYTSLDVVLCAG